MYVCVPYPLLRGYHNISSWFPSRLNNGVNALLYFDLLLTVFTDFHKTLVSVHRKPNYQARLTCAVDEIKVLPPKADL